MRGVRSSLFVVALGVLTTPAAVSAQSPAPKPEIARFFDDPRLAETRAVIVIQDGRVVAENYGKGYGPANRLIGWSMSKSVTATLIGQLVGAGTLALDAPAPVAAWHTDPKDPRGRITLRQLLNMASGLRHDELGEPAVQDSDTNRALFADQAGDAAAFAESRPLADPPGRKFRYSSLTSVILSDIAVRAIAPAARTPTERRAAMRAYLKANLVDPVMPSLICDFDAAGTMIGGSFCHATARDWANFGQLYLDNGRAGGRQIVPAAWVALVRTPSPADPGYSTHFWLNRVRAPQKSVALFPKSGPADLFSAIGHLGQYVMVVPSKRLVVVRLGKTQDDVLDPVRDAMGALVNSYPNAP